MTQKNMQSEKWMKLGMTGGKGVSYCRNISESPIALMRMVTVVME